MIDNTGRDFDRNGLINSQFGTRDVAGNRMLVTIVAHHGNIAHLKDEKGFNYKLPENVLVTLYDQPAPKEDFSKYHQSIDLSSESAFLESFQGSLLKSDDKTPEIVPIEVKNTIPASNASQKTTLAAVFAQFGTKDVYVIDYLGEKLKISIEKIEPGHYGWPHQAIDFQEGNLIIST